jgi:hypothetical protein
MGFFTDFHGGGLLRGRVRRSLNFTITTSFPICRINVGYVVLTSSGLKSEQGLQNRLQNRLRKIG